jgi:peptide/nickel transport system permease protein
VVGQIRKTHGLDRPVMVRNAVWTGGVLRGDFGESHHWNKPVSNLVVDRAPVTLLLSVLSLRVTIVIDVPLGIIAALNPNTVIDRFALDIAVPSQAIPNVWLGLNMIILFAVPWQLFPVSGDGALVHFVLPALMLGASSVPAVMRLTRTGLLDVMESDDIRTARAKVSLRRCTGAPPRPAQRALAGDQRARGPAGQQVLRLGHHRHDLCHRRARRLALNAILGFEIPTVQMLIFLFALIFVATTLLADTLNAALDPRLRITR